VRANFSFKDHFPAACASEEAGLLYCFAFIENAAEQRLGRSILWGHPVA
jgi:hypothetical protein